MKKINVGLIGFGTIGSGVVEVLQKKRSALRDLTGIDIELKYICDKDITSRRGIKVNKKLLTRDPNKILKDPDIDIVVELIGGIHPAQEIILDALKNKKHVVTANKALLAQKGREVFRASRKYNKEVRFEASVAGGIPIIKALREGFISNKIDEIYGIINGTCNYILSRMSDEGCDFKTALKSAQKMGIAEANPVLDVSGADSMHKIVLLAELSFGVFAKINQVPCEGILAIEPRDIEYAQAMGFDIKLLAIAKRANDKVEIRVHPTLVPNNHLLANVKGEYNAVYVKGDLIGETLFYGKGAGKFPTASAVIADIMDLSRQISNSRRQTQNEFRLPNSKSTVKKIEEIKTRYYIRFSALDEPGVLAKIAGILGKYDISIAEVSQKEERREKIVPVVIMTHLAQELKLRKALSLIDRLPVIKKKTVAIRVEAL